MTDLNEKQSRACSTFNSRIMGLLKTLEKHHSTNAHVLDLNRRAKLVIGEDRTFLLLNAGPKLFKYQERIFARDETFFRDPDNIEEFKNIDRADSSASMINELFRLTIETYDKQATTEKDRIYTLVSDCLTSFLEYLLEDTR
jgi:hypothetical protein